MQSFTVPELNTDSSFTCPWCPNPYSFSKIRHFSLKPAGSDKIFTQNFSLAQRLDSGLRNRVHKTQIYQTFSLDIMNCSPSLCPSLYFYPMQGAFQVMVWPQHLSRKWFWCISKCFIHVWHSAGNRLCSLLFCHSSVMQDLEGSIFPPGNIIGQGQ